MSLKRIEVFTPSKKHRIAVQLDDLIAREHRRIQRLTQQRDAAQRKLARARMRFSVLKRLANDQARRAL